MKKVIKKASIGIISTAIAMSLMPVAAFASETESDIIIDDIILDIIADAYVEKAAAEDEIVAVIDGVGEYTNLSSAVRECEDGQTIKLLSNAYFEIIHGGLTLDGEGIYTSSDHRCISLVGSHEDKGPDYSVCTVNENVTVISTDTCTGDQVHGYVAMQSPYGTGVPDVDFMWGYYGVAINFYGTGIGNSGVYINGTCNKTEGSVTQVDLTGAFLMPYCEETESEYNGIYAAGYGEWLLDDTVIISSTAVSMKSGVMIINDGIFSNIGTNYSYMNDDSDSSDNYGAVITFASNEDYAHKAELTINGGEYDSVSMCCFYENIPYKAGTTEPAAPESYVTLTINDGLFSCPDELPMLLLVTIKDYHVVNGGFYSNDYGLADYLKEGKKIIDLRTAKDPEKVITDNTSMDDLDLEIVTNEYPYAVVDADYEFELK